MKTFKTSDGLNLAYHDEGAGLPVLCLPGLTRNSRDFDFVAPHMKHVRLIRLDYRGRGESDYDPNWKNYSVPIEARDVLELLDHLGLEKAALIGTSRGGMISMVLGKMAKDRLLGVLFNDIGPVLEQSGLDLIAEYIGLKPPYKTLAEAAADRPNVMENFANVSPERWLAEVTAQFSETADGLELRYDPKLREGVVATLGADAPNLWPYFDALQGLPLALVRGENSNLLTAQAAADMQERRPDMIFGQVPDRGHIPFLDETESLSVIHEWLGKMA
ncbi:MAG: alpha/beta hydrolase [Rhodobacteraceae bacterium]|nr:alpha/beta hydrolase [Paracoccaceae bacterium]